MFFEKHNQIKNFSYQIEITFCQCLDKINFSTNWAVGNSAQPTTSSDLEASVYICRTCWDSSHFIAALSTSFLGSTKEINILGLGN